MSDFSDNSVNSNCFLSLPNEILEIIVDYLIVDSRLPSSEVDIIPNNFCYMVKRKSFNHIDFKNIISLMNTHPLLYNFVYSRFNSRVYAVFERLPNTNFLKESNDLFIFNNKYDYKQLDVVPEFFLQTKFLDLKNIKKVWMAEADPGLPAFLGSNWIKGVVESPARNLTSIVFDLKITTEMFEYGENKTYSLTFDEADENYQQSVLKNIDYNEFPHFLKKTLKSKNLYSAYREYKLQKLFDSLAKLISLQKVLPAVTLIDTNGFLLQIVSLLWSFQKYNVSDSVRKIDLIAYYFPSPYNLFASYIAGLKKLEKFSFECDLNHFKDDKQPIKETLSVLHEMTFLKHLKLFTNYFPETPILFPENMKRLQITDTALMSISIESLNLRLVNVVELTLKFKDGQMDYFKGDPTNLKFPNLKTLFLDGKCILNRKFIGIFFEANPTITSVSLPVICESGYIPVFFRMMENVECVDLIICNDSRTRTADPESLRLVIPPALQCLSSTSVLIFNILPFGISLPSLITYITEPEEDVAKNLTTIIIYTDTNDPVDDDHRDMFFTFPVSDYYFKGIHVSDFTQLVPMTTNPSTEKIFSSQKLIVDVVKLRKLYKETLVTTDLNKSLV